MKNKYLTRLVLMANYLNCEIRAGKTDPLVGERLYIDLEDCEFKTNTRSCGLVGLAGYGDTLELAAKDFFAKIKPYKTLIYKAGDPEQRREYEVKKVIQRLLHG